MTIGDRIRNLRKKKGMRQEDLAACLCVSYQAVSKWECNLSSPDLGLIGPLTKLLGVTSDELLGLTEEDNDERKAFFDSEYKGYWKRADIDLPAIRASSPAYAACFLIIVHDFGSLSRFQAQSNSFS